MAVDADFPLMTAEMFFEWANRPENEDKLFELVNGKVIELPFNGELHGVTCSWITSILWKYVMHKLNDQARILCNGTALLTSRNPDSLLGPDVMLLHDSRTLDQTNNNFVQEIPALIVEVLSPHDRPKKIIKRINQYVERGVRLIWVVDPDERIVASYMPNEIPAAYREGDIVYGRGVLPGFECPVVDFFRRPGCEPAKTKC